MTQEASRQTIKVLVFRPDRKPNVGERIGVYWKDDKRFYAGEVSSVDQDGKAIVNYDDGDTESLNMDKEIWEFANDPLGYRADSQRHRESNSASDAETGDTHAEDKNGRESEENDDEEHNVHKGQASGSRQEGTKGKKRRAPKTQSTQKIQKTQKNPGTRRSRRVQRAQGVKRAREVQELGARQNKDHLQSVEHSRNRQAIRNQQDAQNEEDENNAEHVHEARSTRVPTPLLIKHLPPVKRYALILKLKQRGYKNEASILEMPFDS